MNIHGELNNADNPIIFGYAATENQIKEYRAVDSEYMRNIKRTNYNFTGNYKALLELLEDSKNGINVLILGHSCGESDQLILGQIFNHQNVRLIEIVYHSREGFFQQIVNIEKLITNEDDYNKIVEYDRSIDLPQFNSGSEYQEKYSKYYKNRRINVS